MQDTVNLSGYRGQTLDLTFKAVTDERYINNFFVDDVAISIPTGDPVVIQFPPSGGEIDQSADGAEEAIRVDNG